MLTNIMSGKWTLATYTPLFICKTLTNGTMILAQNSTLVTHHCTHPNTITTTVHRSHYANTSKPHMSHNTLHSSHQLAPTLCTTCPVMGRQTQTTTWTMYAFPYDRPPAGTTHLATIYPSISAVLSLGVQHLPYILHFTPVCTAVCHDSYIRLNYQYI